MIKFQKRYFGISINISLQCHQDQLFVLEIFYTLWFSAVQNGIAVFSLASSLPFGLSLGMFCKNVQMFTILALEKVATIF